MKQKFFIITLCFLFYTVPSFANDALDLLVLSYKNSGCNPTLIRSGSAEFKVISSNSENIAVEEAMKENWQNIEKKLKEKLKVSGRINEFETKRKQIQDSFRDAMQRMEQKIETFSVQLLGNDNTYRLSNGDQCKRLLDIQEVIHPSNGQSWVQISRWISMGSLNQPNSSCICMEWIAQSNQLELTKLFPNWCEFQTFGRMQELGGSETACIFRAKMDRANFTVPENFSEYFEQEIKNKGLSCEITGEVPYDDDAKAMVIEVKKGSQLLEKYYIDSSRGYLCPYLFVTDESGQISTECTAQDYFLDKQSNLFYPVVYTKIDANPTIGKQKKTYQLKSDTLRFNQSISEQIFTVDLPEGAKVYDKRNSKNNEIIEYTAIDKGVFSLATEGFEPSKMKWLMRQGDVNYQHPVSVKRPWIRWGMIFVGLFMVGYALYMKFRNDRKQS